MIDVYFTEKDCVGDNITVEMTDEFFLLNVKYKLEHSQRNFPSVNVISPTGNSKVFNLLGYHNSGIRYKHKNFTINIVDK